jgi:hypothetical protein
MSDQYARWLQEAGVELKDDHHYELSPLVAFDEADLNDLESLNGQWHSRPK